jgi:hypothetical protein
MTEGVYHGTLEHPFDRMRSHHFVGMFLHMTMHSGSGS